MNSRWWCMGFGGDQERAFQEATAPARLDHFVISGVFSLINYNAFLLVDSLLIPDVLNTAVLLRLCLFTPLGAMVLLLAWRYRSVVLMLPTWVTESTVAMYGVVAGLSMSMLLAMSHSPEAYAYHAGYVAVLVYGNVVQRLRLAFALPFTFSVLVMHWHAMLSDRDFPWAVQWPMAAFIAAMAGYTLLTARRLEMDERERFLQMQRAQGLREQLKASRQQLEEASRRDVLTNVANRRGFDLYLQSLATSCWRDGRALALLVVDVDHFKAFNDRYGHPAGDECLRLVAAELKRHVPDGAGLVARWGGEEFVLVMADLTQPEAADLAQRITRAVQALGVRHEPSTTAATVTVSVGVAAWDGQSLASLDQLMGQADAALYMAKRRGRNRVEVAAASGAWPAMTSGDVSVALSNPAFTGIGSQTSAV